MWVKKWEIQLHGKGFRLGIISFLFVIDKRKKIESPPLICVLRPLVSAATDVLYLRSSGRAVQ